MRKVELFSLPFVSESMDVIADHILERAILREKDLVFTPNVDHLVLLSEDMEFKRAYDRASLVTADGMPIVWFGRLMGKPFPERIAGSDLVERVAEGGAKRGLSIFLVGGAPGISALAAQRLSAQYPGLKIAGTLSPPLLFEKDPEENRRVLEAINQASPDLLLVGLGAPRQEIWLSRNQSSLSFGVGMGVGGTFDFLAGVVRRAPPWFRDHGLEWAFRLMMEPGRLWRRYLLRDSRFLELALKEYRRERAGKKGNAEVTKKGGNGT